MRSLEFEFNTVTECGCCGKILAVRAIRREGLDRIRDKLDRHVAQKPLCKAWYDNLPTFEDIRGILKEEER